MRCKSCDYRLWNLRSRTCPECGTPFRPSEFEFAVNSVQFCCPHCGQDYYGTGEKGHLRPFEFNCVKCKSRINMDEMVCLPTAGVDEEQTQTDRMPWLDTTRTAFRRWTGTIHMALLQPGELLRVTPTDSPLARAWSFFFITYLGTILLATGLFCIIPLVLTVTLPGGFAPGGAGAIAGFGLGGLLVLAIGTLVGVALWALVAHGLLRLTGPTAAGYRRTQQALLYSSGANVITVIPCVGPNVGYIWWVVSGILALKEAQRVNGFRATFAILGLPLFMTAAAVAFYAWFIYIIFTAGPTGPGWLQQKSGVTFAMTTSIRTYAATHNGVGPTHPAELLLSDPTLSPLDFVVAGETPPESVPIGGTNLNLYESLDEKQQLKAIGAAVASAPATPTPQKFGDFIFVYAGVNLNTFPGNTWIVIHEPASAAGTALGGWYDVGLAEGKTIPIPGAGFSTALAAENARRSTFGAPQIPSTLFVATSQPAASQPAETIDDKP